MMSSFKTALNRSRWPALLCALSLPACSVLIHPVVESGLMDEWSYMRSAQLLAQTGHVVYNGWATAMLGWQLLWGAAFVELFGPSYLVARISGLILAMATAFLMHRLFERCGLNAWNASYATMTVVVCPVMFPLALSFMSDIPGMLAMVLCAYACVRALQAGSQNKQAAWICFAALGNAVGGTARQIAWLGVLVLVPCTLWLLRRRRRVLAVGAASWVAGVAIVAWTLRWFHRQPFSVKEPFRRAQQDRFARDLFHLPSNLARPALEMALFLLPVMILFLPALWRTRRRSTAAAWVSLALALTAFGAVRVHRAGLGLVAPFLRLHGDYLSPFGLFFRWPMHCHYPVVLSHPVGVLLTVLTLAGAVAFIFAIVYRDRVQGSPPEPGLPWKETCILMGSLTLSYSVLLLPRLLVGITLDRYLIPLMPLLLVLLLSVYQRRIAITVPRPAWVLLAAVGLYSVAATHDLFANFRAGLAAIDELRAAGVPRTKIDGGWEYNASTQLDEGGYIHQLGIKMPQGESFTVGSTENACPVDDLFLMPDVKPEYSLSMDATACKGHAGFAPVTYRRWLSPHTATVYIVGNPVVVGVTHHNTGGLGGPGDLCWGTDATTPMLRR